MTKKTTVGALVLGVLVGSTFADSSSAYESREADGQLRGTTFFSMTGSQHHWGNDLMDEVLDETYGFGATINYNAAPNLDVLFNYSGVWDSAMGTDLDINAGSLGLNYLFTPESSITPYIGGEVGAAHASVGSFSDTYLTLGARAGAEWSINEQFLLDARLMYDFVDTDANDLDDDDWGMGAEAGIFVTDKVLLSIGGAYFYDTEDFIASVSLTFK